MQIKNNDLAPIFRYEIHDYQNPQYVGNYNFLKKWLNESDEIDEWIEENEEWLFAWEQKLLMDNKEWICSLIN